MHFDPQHGIHIFFASTRLCLRVDGERLPVNVLGCVISGAQSLHSANCSQLPLSLRFGF